MKPYINVCDAPWLAAGDGITNDSAAIQQAINDMAAAGGGKVYLGRRHQLGTTQLIVPPGVSLIGAGSQATTLLFGGHGPGRTKFAILAGNAVMGSGLAYGISLEDFGIQLTHEQSHGYVLTETCACIVRNVYIEGIPNTNTSIGEMVDGGNTSNLFTRLDTVICNHVQTGHLWGTNGNKECTSICATNITSLGDSREDAIGLEIGPGCGLGSQLFGGNFESAGHGVYNSGHGTSFYGTRTEGCSVPFRLVAGARANLHFGCGAMSLTLDSSGNSTNKFLACTTNWNPGYPWP